MSVPAERLRTRTRKRSLNIDQSDIFNRVRDFYDQDLENRDMDREIRLQRYAKYRMWVGEKDWPWEDASNIPLSDMMEKSLRSQDTIHNAVMSSRPIINATARHKNDKDKEDTIDDLIDYQVFEENEGEKFVGDAADAFLNDGVLTIFTPWVKEMREVSDLRVFDPIPNELAPVEYFRQIVAREFQDPAPTISANGWDFTARRDRETIEIKFYTRDNGDVEMVSRENVEVFNGPKPMVMDYDDVLSPIRCENLQIPGPANPGGAAHVILIDNPSVDEIKRLKKSGFYDLLTDDDIKKLETVSPDTGKDEAENQKDAIAGQTDEPKKGKVPSHNKLTRLLVFDCFDIDGDGIDEDVMWWVILELKRVAKASFLGEMYPMRPPRRPFGEASMIPIRGRRTGISLLEILEGLHDVTKSILDQAVDAGTLSNVPFFFYRAAAGVRPEIISLMPGDGYPVSDPKRDVEFPNIGNPQAQAFAINMVTLLEQMKEKATVIGDIQFGRVPPGRSSALRTAGGLALLSGQGEARPERILRRFFMAMTQVWALIHGMNEHFLPKDKQYRIAGFTKTPEDPYQQIQSRQNISGRFDFGFKASVLNTSKQGLQESLATLLQTYVSELAIQLGVIDGDGIYRLLRDFGRSLGQDADAYLTAPSPDSTLPKILAEEAITAILQGKKPHGRPQELGGAQEHLQKLIEFANSDAFGLTTPDQNDLFIEYALEVRQLATDQARQQQLLEAARVFQLGNNQGGRPAESQGVDLSNPLISGGGELLDETLPSAGGGQ